MPKSPKYKEDDLPSPGSVFLTPLADGRFGVVRVIRRKVSDGLPAAFIVPSSWIGISPARPSDSEILYPLILTHHGWKGERDAHWVGSPPPDSFIPVGEIALTPEDDLIHREAYAGWGGFPLQILLEWRWHHDHETVIIEDAARKKEKAEERRQFSERRLQMLRALTLESVAQRTWFEAWDEDHDGLNLVSSRRILAELIHRLSETPAITKTIARKLLRLTVKEFNRVNWTSRFIETMHRDDICEALEMIMWAAQHPELASEIDNWREW